MPEDTPERQHETGHVPYDIKEHRQETPRERALAEIRDALAALHRVPAAGVRGEQTEALHDAVDTVEGLEAALANEVDQLREADDA